MVNIPMHGPRFVNLFGQLMSTSQQTYFRMMITKGSIRKKKHFRIIAYVLYIPGTQMKALFGMINPQFYGSKS